MSRWNLEGRTALVTGASRGIGRAIAEELLGLGARVIAVARGEDELRTQVDAWRARGLEAEALVADVADAEGRAALARHAAELDILVNNAGGNLRRPALDYEEAEIRRLLETNLLAAFELSRVLQPSLRAAARHRGPSRIVNVASVSGLVSTRTGTPYAMAKAAMIQMTRNLAVEWAADGILVNAVAPWYVRTPLVEPLLEDAAYLARILDRTPLGRIGEPEEVASAVAYFCLPASAWTTGQCLAVDGGFTAHGFAP
ncbi:MAG: SDR family oxidoreductase [Planctomycetota bacterium]